MELLAAIDLRGGAAVRLVQGDFARERAYGDPLALAERFVAGGAPWLHVVDLAAARTGAPVHRETVQAIAAHAGGRVQTGGGVRSAADVEALLGAGLARVVLGTAALDDPALALVPPDRRETLMMRPGAAGLSADPDAGGTWQFAIHLSGPQETVFFDV